MQTADRFDDDIRNWVMDKINIGLNRAKEIEVDFVTKNNKEIQKLWKKFSQRKSGFYTKQQENYLKKKPYKISQDKSRLPLQLRSLIQEYIPRETKLNSIELFIRWIIEKENIDEYDDRVQKLIKYERNI